MSNCWWRGRRGEWYVVVQLLLILLVAFGPGNWSGAPAWSPPYAQATRIIGGLLLACGMALAVVATLHLGENLTPLPHPRDDSRLVVHGAYRLASHPIYGGIILAAFGWALWSNGWLTLVYALSLFAFFDVKSRREERWLISRYPAYRDYRQRVRKLIPYIY